MCVSSVNEAVKSSEMGPGFSWMSPDRMMHKSRVNVVAVLFIWDLYCGGVVGIQEKCLISDILSVRWFSRWDCIYSVM